MAHTVKVRCSELLVKRLDALAAGHGGNRSQAVRSAVLAASLPNDVPPVPDRDELLRLLGELARMGSLPAIRLLLAEYRREPSPPPMPDPLAQLLERRRARLGSSPTGGTGPRL